LIVAARLVALVLLAALPGLLVLLAGLLILTALLLVASALLVLLAALVRILVGIAHDVSSLLCPSANMPRLANVPSSCRSQGLYFLASFDMPYAYAIGNPAHFPESISVEDSPEVSSHVRWRWLTNAKEPDLSDRALGKSLVATSVEGTTTTPSSAGTSAALT
jgi:hypothetical protein